MALDNEFKPDASLSVDEWWQVHQRIPTHTVEGREFDQFEFLRMIELRSQGCGCEFAHAAACEKKCLDGQQGVK